MSTTSNAFLPNGKNSFAGNVNIHLIWSTPMLAYFDKKVKKNHSTFLANTKNTPSAINTWGIFYFISATLYAYGLRVANPSHKNTFISAAPGIVSIKCV